MNMAPTLWFWSCIPGPVRELLRDCRGIAATEFAVIVPVMLAMFFGTVEFSSAVAVDRKITIFARTVSDITSQAPQSTSPATSVTNTYLQNAFTSGIAIFYPYLQGGQTKLNVTVSEIYVDSGGVARIVWSAAASPINPNDTQTTLGTSTRSPGDVVTSLVPPPLLQNKTYLIFSEISYAYHPTIGYVMTSDLTMRDQAFSAPRQGTCVIYNNLPPNGVCPLN